jgi:hypothetical protein
MNEEDRTRREEFSPIHLRHLTNSKSPLQWFKEKRAGSLPIYGRIGGENGDSLKNDRWAGSAHWGRRKLGQELFEVLARDREDWKLIKTLVGKGDVTEFMRETNLVPFSGCIVVIDPTRVRIRRPPMDPDSSEWEKIP